MSSSSSSSNDLAPMTPIAVTDGQYLYVSTRPDRPTAIMARPGPGELWAVTDLVEACARRGVTQLWVVPGAAHMAANQMDYITDRFGGWDIQYPEPAPWQHCFKRGTDREVELVFPALDNDSPWQGAKTAAGLLSGLVWYRALLRGVAFHRSAQASGAQLARLLHSTARARPLDEIELPPPALEGKLESPLAWTRALTGTETATCRYLHSWDKNAAFLGACSSLTVGAGAVEYVTAGAVGAKEMSLPGYFLVELHSDEEGLHIPALQRPRHQRAPEMWVTTPTLRYLQERDELRSVGEAYVWREYHQPLQSWYKLLRDARDALMRGLAGHPDDEGMMLALRAVKATYASILGGYLASSKWDRSQDRLYRPDIRHMVIATARSNLIRRAEQCNPWPVAIGGVDTLYWASPAADPFCDEWLPAALRERIGTTLRDFKYKGSAPLSEELAQLLSGASLDPYKPERRLRRIDELIRETPAGALAAAELVAMEGADNE